MNGLYSLFLTIFLLSTSIFAPSAATAQQPGKPQPRIIQEQGSFVAGGSIVTAPGTFDPLKPQNPAGQTYSGDHLYAFYQVPVNARKYPIVMWHGFGQFSKTWETTPDGREGFQNIFLRRGFATYLIDQPRRGNAGRSTAATTITPKPDEQFWFGQFRVGVWPNYFDGVQSAMTVVPEPQNGSSTISPRRLQSLIASATRATGLTVGCMARSCSLPVRMVLTPA